MMRQEVQENDYQPSQPRPYAWKTDEYQTQSEPRARSQSGTQPPYPAPGQYSSQPLTYSGPQYMASNYRCPNCGTTVLPVIERRISTAGWITFALLLVFTFVFFWVGLLMKQNVSVCPVCRATLG
ncbi:MAG: LITAF-like zinc ribbon domain-containing protein [Acidobacteria bacterium]|nr:LITAF-like zinc ribbon domain-containing protein [Acidobacteriota bacterium]